MNKFEQPDTTSTLESPLEQGRLSERPFFGEEQALLEKTGAEIDAAPPEKLKKPGFRALAAFLTFLAGSTAFADRALAERDAARIVADKDAIEKNIGVMDLELRNIYRMEDPPFNMERIAGELVPEESPVVSGFETVKLSELNQSWKNTDPGEFYRNLSQREIQGASLTYFHALREAHTYANFRENLKNLDLNDRQKMAFLQWLGNDLGRIYNYDMLAQGEHIKISEEDMFQALRGNNAGGICGNIHTFMLLVAQEMGFEDVWLESGLVGYDDPSGHVWMGMIAKGADGKDQIVYMDYSRLIATGTLDPVKARGIMERNREQISLFNAELGTKGSVLTPVESLAQRSMKRASGIKGSDSMLRENLERGEISRPRGLELTLDRELTELKISNNTIGLAYVRYEDNNNPYQALHGLDGIRASLHLGGKNMGIDLDTTVLHLTIKDLEGGALQQNEIINRLAAHALRGATLTAGEYGKLAATFGASVEGAARYLLHKPNAEGDFLGDIDGSAGIRIAFLNPTETKEVYIGTLAKVSPRISDFEEQERIIKTVLKQVTAGGTFEVQKGVIVSAEQEHAELEYGTRSATRLGVRVGDMEARARYENTSSQVPSAVPHARRASLEISKNFPQGELVFYGTKADEHYTSVKNTTKQFGVTMRVVLW